MGYITALLKKCNSVMRCNMLFYKQLKDSRKNVIWTNETKVGIIGDNTQHHIWWKPNTAYKHKLLNCQSQWRSDLSSLCSHRTRIPCTYWINHDLLCIRSNVRPSVWQLMFAWNLIMQQGNEPIHPKTAMSTNLGRNKRALMHEVGH